MSPQEEFRAIWGPHIWNLNKIISPEKWAKSAGKERSFHSGFTHSISCPPKKQVSAKKKIRKYSDRNNFKNYPLPNHLVFPYYFINEDTEHPLIKQAASCRAGTRTQVTWLPGQDFVLDGLVNPKEGVPLYWRPQDEAASMLLLVILFS